MMKNFNKVRLLTCHTLSGNLPDCISPNRITLKNNYLHGNIHSYFVIIFHLLYSVFLFALSAT